MAKIPKHVHETLLRIGMRASKKVDVFNVGTKYGTYTIYLGTYTNSPFWMPLAGMMGKKEHYVATGDEGDLSCYIKLCGERPSFETINQMLLNEHEDRQRKSKSSILGKEFKW